MERMEGLYQTTLAETQELLDPTQLDHAAKLIANARQIDIYTGSHNLYPAGMFRDRLLSAGKSATCHDNIEAQVRTATPRAPTMWQSPSPTAALPPMTTTATPMFW